MNTYDLYAETGPKRRKTIVHVPSLGGCTARGDTTDEALAAAPDAIKAYLRFLARHGEKAEPDAPFRTHVAEVMTDGGFLGAAFLSTDLQALPVTEAKRLMTWLAWQHQELRRITAALTPKQLAAQPRSGRPIARILSHVQVEGAYLRGVSGASRIQREVDQGRRDPHDALDALLALERERLLSMTAAERAEVVMRGQSRWTARSGVRKMLEHSWEHYVEIAERLGVEP